MGPGPQCESCGKGQEMRVYTEEFGRSESWGRGWEEAGEVKHNLQRNEGTGRD